MATTLGVPTDPDHWPCDARIARGLTRFADLMALQAELQRERPDLCVLATLDDLGQAQYTSMHAVHTHDLDAEPGDGGTDRFSILLANLRRLKKADDLQRAYRRIDWDDVDDESRSILALNRDPDSALLLGNEPGIVLLFVPVDTAADAIAAFPNGYFSQDLSPMQNHALAARLEATHGMALSGIGASFLAFRRAVPLDASGAEALAGEIADFYEGTPPDDAAALAGALTGRDWLLLRYTA